jgi:hypothetical protein
MGRDVRSGGIGISAGQFPGGAANELVSADEQFLLESAADSLVRALGRAWEAAVATQDIVPLVLSLVCRSRGLSLQMDAFDPFRTI